MNNPIKSRIFRGHVFHHRLRPTDHKLNYKVFSLLLDLDELPQLSSRFRFFGYNRFSLFSFWDRDHGDGSGRALRPYVHGVLHDAGIEISGGRVELLCYPRIFGYVFNPLSVYYCYGDDETLRVVIYEVSNTFGERHSYVIETNAGSSAKVQQRCRKKFHVSPFLPVAGVYDFDLHLPADRVKVKVDLSDDEGLRLRASFSGRALEITDKNLLKMLIRYPLMTVKITAAIHWEAVKLWRKGLPFFSKPKPPLEAHSHIQSASSSTE